MPSLRTTASALAQLGVKPVLFNALYRLGLHIGWWRRMLPERYQVGENLPTVLRQLQMLIPVPQKPSLVAVNNPESLDGLRVEADELIAGKVRLFGATPVSLLLNISGRLAHWSAYELGKESYPLDDPKFTWEPARFGWVFTLGRAYFLHGYEACAQAFWRYTVEFLQANPPYLGPNWVSAQEVALRLIAFTWALRLFTNSPHSTPDRQAALVQAIAQHAARIPPTLIYARSQNNNHLLTEAAGLFTAGSLLAGAHPQAKCWQALGWRWFHQGIREQIAADGSYIQHSSNYHRLMLQIALWMLALAARQKIAFPALSQARLAAATQWLHDHLDCTSGRLPNLGANDGAYIFPFTSQPFHDYRPVLESASRAFLHTSFFADSLLAEMPLWFDLPSPTTHVPSTMSYPLSSIAYRLTSPRSHAFLRAVHFTSRPGHADQLHLDLWWRGLNIAQDAGTYRYTALPPWDNALTHAAVHNTVTVDGQDQMRRAGRFLYLDWAQAELAPIESAPDGSWKRLAAWHAGYHRLGILHQRSVTAFSDDHWLVEDWMLPNRHSQLGGNHTKPVQPEDSHVFRLHWLLPDWEWRLEANLLNLASPYGTITLTITAQAGGQVIQPQLSLVRAGERLIGKLDNPLQPILGWVSPTYTVKNPALSLVAEVRGCVPLQFQSLWQFP